MMYAWTEIEGKDDEKHQELESLQHNIALCVSQGPMNSLFFSFLIAFTCMKKDSTLWQEIKGFGSLIVHVQQIKQGVGEQLGKMPPITIT